MVILEQVLVTFALTLVIAGLLWGVFRWVKTPYYRVDKARMIRVLEMALTGQATENEWRITFGMIIRHDPELEAIRQQCCDIEDKYFMEEGQAGYLFSSSGLAELKNLLELLAMNTDDEN
jgi:hypothetical protein